MLEKLVMRRAEPQDVWAVFELSNDPIVRANSIHSEPIAWEKHVAWFNKVIDDKNVKFFVVETCGGEFVGELRLQKERQGWVVTIHICTLFRGNQIGQWILSEMLKRTRIRRFVAFVKPDNVPSNRLFAHMGYQRVGEKLLVAGDKRIVLNSYLFVY